MRVWTRYRPGSQRQNYVRDFTAEIVMATSTDGITWSLPVPYSPPDPHNRHIEFLPFAFEDIAGSRLYVSWTSDRSGPRADILIRAAPGRGTPVLQLTAFRGSDYSSKIVPTPEPGEYLMAWTGIRKGRHDIFVRRFRL